MNIPGEVMTAAGEITLNADRAAITMMVANTGDRPVQVGAHYHFFEANPALDFDRDAARGRRLDIAAGTAVRFEPGQRREVRLIEIGGARRVYGFAGKVMGPLAVALLLLIAPAAEAQKRDCTDPQDQASMTECAWVDYQNADAVLNQEWSRAIDYARRIGAEDTLREAQRLWIPYRDAACRADATNFEGGSMQPMVEAFCLTRLTQQRTDELASFRSF